ncbi:MAG: penicillin-binding protein [Thermotogaceae bacterium]|nr:penicillin-binding protein [Thermotogaceae bacterium]
MRGKIILLSFIFLTLAIILWYAPLQLTHWKEYRDYIDSIGIRTMNIPSLRGKIISSDGKVFAKSESIYKAQLLGRNIPNYTELSKIVGKDRANELILGNEVEVSEIEANELKKMGVYIRKDFKRIYSGAAPHVVGYISGSGMGIYGVEKQYNDFLTGQIGSELVMVDKRGKIISTIVKTPPLNGKDITLTIDSKLQSLAQNLLSGQKGSVIMMDVKSGDILAMASSPYFNPNKISSGLSPREWKKLLNDPESAFLNRAISSAYPPGSAIKPFIALAYLLSTNEATQVVDCEGIFKYKNSKGKVVAVYKDWLLSGHGITDLKKAIRVSCNVYFYTIGLETGIDKMKEIASLVKLDEKTGIDLPGEAKGLFPSKTWKMLTYKTDWYPGDTILVSIGQGYVKLTPLELITFYALLANDGVSYVPHVVKKIGDEEIKPKIFVRLEGVPKKIWEFLREAMIEVTTHPGSLKEEGTAYRVFKGFPIKVAGKTGTAEVGKGLKSHSWFIGYAPAGNPQVVVLAMVEHGGPGSSAAAPLARRMLEEYFGVAPKEKSETETEPKEVAREEVETKEVKQVQEATPAQLEENVTRIATQATVVLEKPQKEASPSLSIPEPQGKPVKNVIENRQEEKGEESGATETSYESNSHGSMILLPHATQNQLRNEGYYGGERGHENRPEPAASPLDNRVKPIFPFLP